MKVSLSSKDKFIETRTKIIVGVMPWPKQNFISKKYKKKL